MKIQMFKITKINSIQLNVIRHKTYYYGLKYRLILQISLWVSIYIYFNLYWGISLLCEHITKPYDGRTCYEIMNEPNPYPNIVVNKDGWFEYLQDGNVICHWADSEISVKEHSKWIPENIGSNNESSFSSDSENDENSDSESGAISDTSNHSSSDTEKTTPNIPIQPTITYLSNTNDILKDYYLKMLPFSDKADFLSQSINYVKELIPIEMWSTGEAGLGQDELAQYLGYLATTIDIKNYEESDTFIKFYSTLTAYNTVNLFPEHQDDPELFEKIFDNSVEVTTSVFQEMLIRH